MSVVIFVRVGISLTAATSTFTCTALLSAPLPSCALTVNAGKIPFAFTAAFHWRSSPLLNVVVPGITFVQPAPTHFSSDPVDIASILKSGFGVSTSNSFAEVAKVENGIRRNVSSVAPEMVAMFVSVGESFSGEMFTYT